MFLIILKRLSAVCFRFFISFLMSRFLVWRYILSSFLNIFSLSDFWSFILFLTMIKSSRSCRCLNNSSSLNWSTAIFSVFSSATKRLSFRFVCIFLRQKFNVFMFVLLYINCVVDSSSIQSFYFLLMYARKYCSSVWFSRLVCSSVCKWNAVDIFLFILSFVIKIVQNFETKSLSLSKTIDFNTSSVIINSFINT